MATLTIRGLDEETHARLRIRAAQHGRSMEAEVRAILTERLTSPTPDFGPGAAFTRGSRPWETQTSSFPHVRNCPGSGVRRVIILDTNVILELARVDPEPNVVTWLDTHPPPKSPSPPLRPRTCCTGLPAFRRDGVERHLRELSMR